MSSIMRGDQTVQLIQLYHAHYPEIARNTQDCDGRKQRVHMWAKITEDLNKQFSTTFSVEQFKKKVQNVQCTSRQKMQNNKKNLGEAEQEYMRLFGNDSSSEGALSYNFGLDSRSSRSRTSSRCGVENEGGGEVQSSIKAEQMFNLGLGLDSVVADDCDTTNIHNSLDIEGQKLHEEAASAEVIGQLLTLASNLNNLSQMGNAGGNLVGTLANFSSPSLAARNGSGNRRKTLIASEESYSHNSGPVAKRRRKQAHALHLRNRHGILPTNGLEAEGGGILGLASSSSSNFLDSNGFGLDHQVDEENGPLSEQKWRNDILEMQRSILENQRRILDLMERQANSEHRHNSQTPPSIFTPPSPPAANNTNKSNVDAVANSTTSALQTLCSKLDSLASALGSVDQTIKQHFPAGQT